MELRWELREELHPSPARRPRGWSASREGHRFASSGQRTLRSDQGLSERSSRWISTGAYDSA